MPSGLLLGGASRTCPRKAISTVSSRSIDDPSRDTQQVTLRENKVSCASSDGSCDGVRQRNKRNATYLNDDEYDEDLAQLDVLLHYVNNLSASLEFLKWEDKRISTDLVPTLLNMYDALYARLSESPREDLRQKQKEESSDTKDFLKAEDNMNGNELFIIEEDLNHQSYLTNDGICEKCGAVQIQSPNTPCNCIRNQNNNNSHQKIEHDYDIPESIEKPPDEVEIKPKIKSPPHLKDGSPLLNSKICRDLLYRPLSSISSSSSSSSSNSLPRGPVGTLASYLASAESLEDNPTSDAETSRRRDRGLKARREKALRAGSDDSGVQCHSISLPVPPTLRPRYCDPNLNYMDRVVLEIVETEEIYVRDLQEVIEGYLQHWKSEPNSSISLQVAQSLFSNIEQIFKFNRGFLRELELCGTDPVLVAKCFVRNNSGFAIYTEYCTNYPRTVSVLTDLMRGECSVKACRERQLVLGHTLPLGSYLLKPVQRVLKYHLLLGNIVKHFDKDRPGHAHIWNALSAMTGIAQHINDMKRKHEHAVRVQEIQSLLYGWQGEDLTTFGELAAEGAFRMFGVKGLRHVFLFDKILLITKKKDENILMYKAHIMCSDLMLIESIPREPLSFHVIPFDNPKRQYTLECRNLEQKREWTLQLKRVILENYSATIPAHARQLVMELGQNSKDAPTAVESRSGGRRAHCAPEYLEKRKDKRRASEGGGFNSRLRIRRSSRTRKEKENRSRSVSRNRETDEDEDSRSSFLTPPVEKSKLRLPMWRRRSEPGIRGRLSLPTSPETEPPTPLPPLTTKELSPSVEEDEKDTSSVAEDTLLFDPEETSNERGYSECTSLYECDDDNDEVAEENLEHIVSQLLQHQLQVQQNLLNKQRRGLIRKKNNTQYETSDTENEDHEFDSLPPLPKSPPPMLSSAEPIPFSSEYIDLLFKQTEQEWSSGAPSGASSTQSVNRRRSSIDSGGPKSASVSRSGSDIGTKTMNYDNLTNVWSQSKLNSLPRHLEEETKNSFHSSVRRIHSFSNDLKSETRNANDVNIRSSEQTKDDRERPATIAIYDQPTTDYLTNSTQSESTLKQRNKPNSLLFSKSSHYSVDNLVNIHPEHKIYSKAYVNKGSIKKVLSRITNPRGSPTKTISEPSQSLSNIYVNSEFEKATIRKSTNLVSSMARQCSKNLKERIKQIRIEDVDSTSNKTQTSPIKLGSSFIGARLATTNEATEYAVPVIATSELRPDSVLSSSSLWTSSSSSSSKEAKTEVFIEEDNLEGPLEAEDTGDSFYERSFEAIETFLEDEIFRDSAIYSEPEDSDSHGLSPRGSFRTTLSPKSSFRKTSVPSKKWSLTVSKSFDAAMLVDTTKEKKTPPPVPVKPDAVSLKKLRFPKGNLIQQQLRNLEESQRQVTESSHKQELDGIKSLSERREELKTFSGKISPERLKVKKSLNRKLNQRKSSLDSCLDVAPPVGFSYSPQLSSSNILKDLNEDDEAIMSKGWVKHVIGKLQQ